MREIIITFVILIIVVYIYGITNLVLSIYKSNRAWKASQEDSKSQLPTYQPLSGELSKTYHERYVSENSQRLSNGFYRTSIYRTP